MFVRVWQFRPRAECVAEFESRYGPTGAWAKLFARRDGFFGTSLRRVPGTTRNYEVVDRWESRDAWEAFQHDERDAYEQLDRDCERLSEMETLVREYDDPLS